MFATEVDNKIVSLYITSHICFYNGENLTEFKDLRVRQIKKFLQILKRDFY